MAGAPRFKVFSPTGEYVASCKYPSDAAAIVAAYGEAAQIRDGHSKKHTLFTNGPDGDAGESYDAVAEHCFSVLASLSLKID